MEATMKQDGIQRPGNGLQEDSKQEAKKDAKKRHAGHNGILADTNLTRDTPLMSGGTVRILYNTRTSYKRTISKPEKRLECTQGQHPGRWDHCVTIKSKVFKSKVLIHFLTLKFFEHVNHPSCS